MGIFLIASASATDLNETDLSQIDDEIISVEEIDDAQSESTDEAMVEDGKLSADNDSEVLGSTHYASDFNDLKSKVSNAQDGDTIVLSGSYSFASEIAVNKKLTFIGTNNAVLDGRKSNRLFTTNADGVSFKDITFQNGKSNDANGGAICANKMISIDNCRFINNYAGWSSGAVRVENNAVYNISNSYFEGNNGDHGGALSIFSSSGLVYNCTFYKNIGRRSAGVSECGNFEKCRFIENIVNDGHGGAIDVWTSNICTITNCSFIGNAATTNGGALCLNDNSYVFDCYFEENSAEGSGAIYGGNIENCTFIRNHANFGGAVGAVSVINSRFADNYGNYGGSIHIREASGRIISNCSFVNEHAENYGGAIDIYNVQNIIISNCNFFNCYCNNNRGGAIACEKANNMNISGCTFESCHSKDTGGAVRLDASTNVYVGNSTFINNYADNGGAIRIGSFNNVYSSIILIEDCNFKNNAVAYFGGAIDGVSVTDLHISGCNFTECFAEGNEGGAISSDSTNNLNISQCSFKSCHSKNRGGAIRAEGSNDVNIEDNNFTNCYSGFGGSIELGILNNKSCSNVNVARSTFVNSSGNNGGAIHIDVGLNINMNDLTFRNCFSSKGSSCIDVYKTNDLSVNGCNLSDSSSSYGAIGLFDIVNSIDITDCRFNNCSSVNDGAAVYWNYGNSLNIGECTFTKCISENGGNSIKVNSETSSYSVGNCIFDVIPQGIDYYYDSYLDVNNLSVVQGDDIILSGRLYYILNPLNGKTITFNINGEEYTKTTFSDGSFEFDITDYLPNLGEYNISVTWSGGGVFKPVSNVSNVRVNSYIGNLSVNQTGKYYGDTWLNFKLINSRTGNPIAYAPVKLVFSNNKTASRTTNEDGLCSYNIPFAPGTYSVTAYVDRGNVDVNSVELNNIVINKIVGQIEITQMGVSRALNIRLFNPDNGDAYRNIVVSLEFTNSAYADLKTNDNGIATYRIPFDIGTYSVVAKVAGDYMEFSNGELKGIRITADSGSSDENPSTISFGNNITFDYLKSGSTTFAIIGCTIQQAKITVVDHPEIRPKLSGNRITVSGLNLGTYTMRVITTPLEGYYSFIGIVKITVKKVSAKISVKSISLYHKESKKWTIKLVDTKTGKGISKMQINLRVFTGKNSKDYKVTTNSNGVATFNDLKKLSVGKHKVVLSFSKYGYDCKSVTSSVNVKKVITLAYRYKVDNLATGSSIKLYVKNKATKKPINGVTLKLNVYYGKNIRNTYKLVTGTYKDSDGKVHKGFVSYATNKIPAGKHKLVFKPTSGKYKEPITIKKFKIKKEAKKHRKIGIYVSKGKTYNC